MTNHIEHQINNILSNITFSDNSTVQSRASKIKMHNKNIAFSVDISGIELLDAEKVRQITIKELQQIHSIDKTNIVLTSVRESEPQAVKSKIHISGVKNIVVIASGKGGVGKSTISALLAHKLVSEGKKVGIVDADIHGPSIPNIFNIQSKPEIYNQRMIPLKNYGILLNSIGFIIDQSKSISWRGPMVSKALYQLLSLTDWGKIDYLIIDTPPGTGDIHLSILQNYFIDHTLMVTTPQKISELDVTKSINLYQKFNIPILGIIENMSYYYETQTQNKIHLFSGNSGESISKQHKLPLLTKLPLNTELSKDCDAGADLKKYSYLLQNIQL